MSKSCFRIKLVSEEMKDCKALEFKDLEAAIEELNEPKFRAKQVFEWLHKKKIAYFDEMANVPAKIRAELSKKFTLNCLKTEKKLVSDIDGTVKYLYRLFDGQMVESVFMRYNHGQSLCISTQVGCRMGCEFCASAKGGFIRNLTPDEMLEQIYAAERDLKEPVSGVVLMGIGEPLDNYDNVLKFLRILSDENGRNMSLRHVCLSTCGLVEKIENLAKERLSLTLSVSLHAPDDETRQKTMPVAKRYPMEVLLSACEDYARQTGRRVTYEYALINGINDSRVQAEILAEKLKGTLCHVNLIPVNKIKESEFSLPDKHKIEVFKSVLEKYGISATVRRTLGADINAACGQLRRDTMTGK